MTLVAMPLLMAFSAPACARTGSEARADAPLIAMAPPPTDSPAAYRAALTAPPPTPRVPDQVLHDPAQRFALLERLRTEVVHRTRHLPDGEWYTRTRPTLRRQLEQAGLPRADVSFLLAEIDRAR